MDDKLNGDKEMAKGVNMYNGCIKYKSEIEKNSKKKVNCDEY